MNGYKVLKTMECFLPACCDIIRVTTNKIWDGIIFDNQPGHNCISCLNLPLNNRNKKIRSIKTDLKATCYKYNLKNIFGEGWPQHDSTSYLYLGVSQYNIFQKKELGECLSAESRNDCSHLWRWNKDRFAELERTRNILMRIKSIVLKDGFYENREDSFVRSSNVWLVVVRSTTFNRLFISPIIIFGPYSFLKPPFLV